MDSLYLCVYTGACRHKMASMPGAVWAILKGECQSDSKNGKIGQTKVGVAIFRAQYIPCASQLNILECSNGVLSFGMYQYWSYRYNHSKKSHADGSKVGQNGRTGRTIGAVTDPMWCLHSIQGKWMGKCLRSLKPQQHSANTHTGQSDSQTTMDSI